MSTFVGVDLGQEPIPDEAKICNLRHLMERHNQGDQLLRLVNVYLKESVMKVAHRTNVDVPIINATSSAKNKDKNRDLEMRQTRKEKQWYFWIKAHIGLGSKTRNDSFCGGHDGQRA